MRRVTVRRPVVVAAAAAVVLVAAGSLTAASHTPPPKEEELTASCSPAPKVTPGVERWSFSVRCSVPKPSPVTVTATQTVTVTATASATPPPSTTTTAPPPPPVTTTTSAPPPPATTTTTAPPPPTTTAPPPQQTLLDLPRIPWEGGAAYYAQFPDAAAYGWADPTHFPIALWWAVFNSDAEVQWDKAHGINTYIVTNDKDPNAYPLMERNGMSWVGGQLAGMTRTSKAWVGDFLDDEVDGRYPPAEGHAYLQGIVDGLPDHRKFRQTNYTQQVINIWQSKADSEKYVNAFTDAVSLDMYWYTIPFCSWEPYPTDYYIQPVPQGTCRTASSYGRSVEMLRQRDAADGKLQPVWNFIENVSGSPAEISTPPLMTPGQVKGAAWASLIAEARGLMWFNNVFGGPCGSGNAIRSAQVDPGYACKPQIEAMGQVNNQVQRLAPVLNSQSYQWDFGPGLRTMLKARDGYAYVFAMTDGTTGTRTLTLPAGVSGATAEVVDEGRTVPVDGGKISDAFADESAYHIYKIKL